MNEPQDEFRAVRELFAEPDPPRPEIVAAVRDRLAGSGPGPARWRPQIRLRVTLPVTAATAMAAAVAVVLAITLPSSGPPRPHHAGGPRTYVVSPGRTGGASTHQSSGTSQPGAVGVYHLPVGAAGSRTGTAAGARNVLLTAARTVGGSAPPAGSLYYEEKSVVGNFISVGPRSDPYLILEKVGNQQWTALAADTRSPELGQALSVQAASPRDAAAWRRSGSPTSWPINQETWVASPQGFTGGWDRDIAAGRGPLELSGSGVDTNNKNFSFAGHAYSAAGLRGLPTDPAKLKALILWGYRPGDGNGTPEDYLFAETPILLTLPVTAAVRAALYQMLAALPGVRSLGHVTDVAGQPGEAVALTGTFRHCGGRSFQTSKKRTAFVTTIPWCTVEQRLVISAQTGLPLSQELRYVKLPKGVKWDAPDGLFSYQLFSSENWTSANPPIGGGKVPAPRKALRKAPRKAHPGKKIVAHILRSS